MYYWLPPHTFPQLLVTVINKQQKVIFAAAHRSSLCVSFFAFSASHRGDLIFLPLLASGTKEVSMTFATSSTSPLELSCTTAPGSPCLQRCHSTAPARNSTLGSLLSLFRTTSVRGLPFPVPTRGFSGGLLTRGAALFWKAGAEWCLLAGREALKKGGTPLGGVARGTLAVTWHLGLPGQCWERTGRHKQRGWCPRGEGNLCPQSKAAEMETSTSPSTHQKALMWPSLLLSCCGGSKTPPHTLRVAFLAIFFF